MWNNIKKLCMFYALSHNKQHLFFFFGGGEGGLSIQSKLINIYLHHSKPNHSWNIDQNNILHVFTQWLRNPWSTEFYYHRVSQMCYRMVIPFFFHNKHTKKNTKQSQHWFEVWSAVPQWGEIYWFRIELPTMGWMCTYMPILLFMCTFSSFQLIQKLF